MDTPAGRLTRWLLPTQIVLALVALTLGIIGYAQTDLSNPVYRSIALFAGDTETLDDEPLAVAIARWLALAVTLSAVVTVTLAVLGRSAGGLIVRALYRGHVVVAGDAPEAARIAAGMAKGGRKTVLLTVADDVEEALARGVRVLPGDPASARRLRAAAADRAEVVVVATSDDVTTTHAALVATRAAEGARVIGLLRDPVARAQMQQRILGTGGRVVELLSFSEIAAERAVGRVPPFADGAAAAAVIGEGPLAEAIAIEVARAAPPDSPADLHVAGFTATRLRQSGLESRVRLHVSPDLDARAVAARLAGEARAACYLCPPAGIGEAFAITGAAPGASVLMLVDGRSSDVAGAAAATLEEIREPRVQALDLIGALSGPDLLDHGAIEEIARAKHAQYLRDNAGGRAMGAEPSMLPWDQLGPGLRQDNRDFARGALELLRREGLRPVPDPSVAGDGEGLFSDDDIERLARDEHDRWMRDKARGGWTYGPERDNERKIHPLMVPWEDLSEEDRDKDRDPIRDLSGILAAAGLRVERDAGT